MLDLPKEEYGADFYLDNRLWLAGKTLQLRGGTVVLTKPGWHRVACCENGKMRGIEDITGELLAALKERL